MFIRNAWYGAATPDETNAAGAGRPLARQVCGERMVRFRCPAGQVAALEDFCPHRGVPLSLGRVCDAELTTQIRVGQGRIFKEGRALLEQQQRNLAGQPQRELLKLNIDTGGVMSRRLIHRLLAAEAAAASAPSPAHGLRASASCAIRKRPVSAT